jgi:cyclic pyranopterin phosphate synthase
MAQVDTGQQAGCQARASGRVRMKAETLELIRKRQIGDADVIELARLAGIMAAKRVDQLFPLCQPVPLDAVQVAFDLSSTDTIALEAIARATAESCVDMAALVAVSTAALAIYDLCQKVDGSIAVEQLRLEEKSGGPGGHFVRPR